MTPPRARTTPPADEDAEPTPDDVLPELVEAALEWARHHARPGAFPALRVRDTERVLLDAAARYRTAVARA